MLTAYTPEVFNGLEEFFSIKEKLEEVKENLTELGQVIRRYDLQKKVGICLLHKHFDLSPNERLVEEFQGNNSYIKPTTDYEEAIPYMWKVERDSTSGQWVWFPLEFVRGAEAAQTTAERSEAVLNNHEFMSEIAAKLSELGLTSIFGIGILHRDAIQVAEGEILVESTDDEARVLTFASLPRPAVDPTTLTQTLWQFPTAQGYEVGSMCQHCTHCTHCTH